MAQITNVKLYSGVPMTPNNHIQLDFTYLSFRDLFLRNYLVDSLDELTYIRENNHVRIEGNIDNLKEVNYIVYKNQNRYYYAFVIDHVYINDDTTELVIQTDDFQTYYNEYNIPSARVVREHRDRYKKVGATIYPIIDNVPEDINLSDIKVVNQQCIIEDVHEVEGDGVVRPHMWAIIRSSKKFVGTHTLFESGGVMTYLAYVRLDSSGTRPYMQVSNLDNNLNKEIMPIPYLSDILFTENNKNFTLYHYAIQHEGTISITLTPFLPWRVAHGQVGGGEYFIYFPDYMDSLYTPIVMFKGNYLESKLAMFKSNDQIDYVFPNATKKDRLDIFDFVDDGFDLEDDPKLYHSDFTSFIITDYKNDLEVNLEQIIWPSNHELVFNYIDHINIDGGYTISLDGYNGDSTIIGYKDINLGITRGVNYDLITDDYLAYKRNQQAQDITGDILAMVTSALSIVGGVAMGVTGLGAPIGAMAVAGGIMGIGSTATKMGVTQTQKTKLGAKVNKLGNEIGLVKYNQMGIFRLLKTEKGSANERASLNAYFSRYGYITNEQRNNPLMSLKSRTRFNYLELDDIILMGSIPNNTINNLVDLYKGGIWVFHINETNYNSPLNVEFNTLNKEVSL